MASNLSSAVVATAMVASVDTGAVAVVVMDAAMAIGAVDAVVHEEARGVDPAVMLPRRRHRGRATVAKDAITRGGGEWVWTRALKQAVG